MTRTDLLKVTYLLGLVSLGALAFFGLSALPDPTRLPAMALTALLLLIPGRVQGVMYRSLYRGTKALNQQRFADAVQHLQAFLDQVDEAPWKRRLVWLAWTVYTPDVEAMTWHNLAIAELGLDHREDADAAAQKALDLDPRYPLPHVTLAQLALTRGAREEAERQVQLARDKGYRGTTVDQLLHQLQAGLADLEGRDG